MGLPRNDRSRMFEEDYLFSSKIKKRRNSNTKSLSQPGPSTSSRDPEVNAARRICYSQRSPSPDHIISEEDNQLANSLIRYLFALDRGKQIINKTRIIKSVFNGQGKQFNRVLIKVKNLLSEIFGYQLVELEGNKYMLINEIENSLLHLHHSETGTRQQTLLFVVLIHIFMYEGSCSEESLWDFLTHMGINCVDNSYDSYFGNVKHLITEVFVAQKYLVKEEVDKNNSSKVTFRWGPRADHEFSRRKSLEFVSQVYNGQPLKNWPLQYKALIAWEKSNE